MKRLLSLCLVAMLLLSFASISLADERPGDPIELTFFSINSSEAGAKSEEAQAAIEQKIWEDTGVNAKITMVSSDSFAMDQIPVKIAAGELDGMYVNVLSRATWQDFVNKGIVLQLDDLLAEYGQDIVAQIMPKLWDPYKFDGKIYQIPLQAPVPFYCSTWLRMDLFRKYGIEKIPETVSELIEGIKVVRANDPTLVGISAGHISWVFNSGPLNYHPVGADGETSKLNADGTAMIKYIDNSAALMMPWEDPQFKTFLQRLQDAYLDGVLDPEIFTTTYDHAGALVASGSVICMGSGYWEQDGFDRRAGLDPERPLAEDQEPQEWVHLSHLVNDINDAPTTWRYDYETGGFIGLISTTKYPVEAMKILNWFCASEENYALSNWGIQDEHWYYDEDGYKRSVKDDVGENVVKGAMGTLFMNIRSDWWGPISEKHIGTEWQKIFAGAPETKTWATQDGFINYSFETEPTVITDLTSIADEFFASIVTGAMSVDDGLAQMAIQLGKAGYQGYYDEMNQQYMEGMGYTK